MNFLSKTLGSLTGSSIPYTLGEKVESSFITDPNSYSIWNVYDAVKKEDSLFCTVFEFDQRLPQNSKYIPFAINACKKLRSTKLPGVLNTIDTIQNDSHIYIITERVEPLSKYLLKNPSLSNEILKFGTFTVSRALRFINCDAKSIHGNVNIHSVFVNNSGEWKLGGFEVMTNISTDGVDMLRLAHQLPSFNYNLQPAEFEKSGTDCLIRSPQSSIKYDAFKLGLLIVQIFSSTKIGDSILINQFIGKVPVQANFQTNVKKLLNQSITLRITVEVFFKTGLSSFFKTPLIDCFLNLEMLNVKDAQEKLEFFNSLSDITRDSPNGFVEYKILPNLIQLFYFTSNDDATNTSVILINILKFSLNLNTKEFNNSVKPIILKSFTMADRSIRMALLTSLSTYIEKFTQNEVSNHIFNNLLTGSNDTNPKIREETLKAIIPIAPKLSDRQLNNDLLRYLAKAQNDTVPEIRTNTVICLGKIAQYMNKNSRPGILITAFSKSLKDPFVPSRLSAIMAFASCIDFFPPEICCSRVLSSIAPNLLDKSSKVRIETGKIFELYMEKIRAEASSLPVEDDSIIEHDTVKNEELNNHMVEQQNLSMSSIGWSTLNALSNKIGGSLSIRETPLQSPALQQSQTVESLGGGNNNNDDNHVVNNNKKLSSFVIQPESTFDPWENDNSFANGDDAWGYEMQDDEEHVEESPEPNINEDSWGFGSSPKPASSTYTIKENTYNHNVRNNDKVTAKTQVKTKTNGTGNEVKKNSGLKLSKTSKSTKLKLDLQIDGNDGWGDGEW
ncbi:hypothetical protein PACTADRAFT_49431 [Pachysolen tannophilus NRRL Y-2460]|uniref:Protein kinase domain-containing protein n=1 Tax=Pachysolen tannophilus NRRL Y-2460 TaxID=669874 RepID=A0A1E4TWA0_PACTA|nr:hypothetical protein PACTADRAFT_49431 [Pachysolen tannophilus NRRL Y-2460]